LRHGCDEKTSGPVVDAESGLIYMRARYYDPATAQFISRDPLTAMTGAPYSYADNDPLNGVDPTGLICLSVHCLANDAKQVATHASNIATGVDTVGFIYGEVTSGGNCHLRHDRVECRGAWSPFGPTWTFGDVIMNPDQTPLTDKVFAHEAKHSTQWAALGWGFPIAYGIDRGVEGRCNSFEHEAGYGNGGYNDPPNPCIPSHAAACTPDRPQVDSREPV
jgi:RHS repeat-associated protein